MHPPLPTRSCDLVGTPFAPPGKPKRRLPGAGLDDAYKVPQAHFMWGLLQTNSRKSRCRAYGLNKLLFAQTAPPPLRGRGTGWGQIRRGYLWSASVRSTDLDFSPQKNLNPYPAQLSVKGVCQGGSSVPLDRVLVPFTRVKGTPPRRAVLTMPLQKPPRRRQATANYPPPGRRTGYAFAKGRAPPLGDRQLGLKIFYLLFLGEKQPLAGHEWRAKRDFAL